MIEENCLDEPRFPPSRICEALTWALGIGTDAVFKAAPDFSAEPSTESFLAWMRPIRFDPMLEAASAGKAHRQGDQTLSRVGLILGRHRTANTWVGRSIAAGQR